VLLYLNTKFSGVSSPGCSGHFTIVQWSAIHTRRRSCLHSARSIQFNELLRYSCCCFFGCSFPPPKLLFSYVDFAIEECFRWLIPRIYLRSPFKSGSKPMLFYPLSECKEPFPAKKSMFEVLSVISPFFGESCPVIWVRGLHIAGPLDRLSIRNWIMDLSETIQNIR